jgi:dCMP deaminase
LSPCKDCSKLIIQAGIVKVVYKEVYEGSTEGLDLMKESGIKIIKI